MAHCHVSGVGLAFKPGDQMAIAMASIVLAHNIRRPPVRFVHPDKRVVRTTLLLLRNEVCRGPCKRASWAALGTAAAELEYAVDDLRHLLGVGHAFEAF